MIHDRLKQVEKIKDPVAWLENRVNQDGKKLFTFLYPSAEETTVLGGEDIEANFKRKKLELELTEDEEFILGVLVSRVKAPIIRDEFTNSKERRDWEKMNIHGKGELQSVFDANKLSRNFMGNVFQMIELYDADTYGPLPNTIMEEYRQVESDFWGPERDPVYYGNLPIEQKIILVKRIGNFTRKLYESIVKQYESK